MSLIRSTVGQNLFRFFVFPFILWLPAHGQSSRIDSLQTLIDAEKENPTRVDHLNQLTAAYFRHDLTMARTTSVQALALAKKIGDTGGEAWATTYEGLLNLFEGSLKEAEYSFSRAAVMNKGLNDPHLKNYLLMQLGNLYRNKGLFDSAFYYFAQSEALARTAELTNDLAIIKMNMARAFLIIAKPDSALVNLRVAESIWKQAGKTESLQDTWLLMGNAYRGKSELDEAERYAKKAVETDPVQPVVKGQYLINMGEIYFDRGNFPKALENWLEALRMTKQLNYRYELAYLLSGVAEAYEEEGFYDLAAEYLSQSLKIAEKAPFYFLMGEIYYEYAWVNYRNQQYDLAYQSIQKAEREYRRCRVPLRQAGIFNVKGQILMRKKSYDSSLFYHLQSLDRREKLGNKIAVSSSLHNLGELHNWWGKYAKALPYLWRGLAIDESIQDDYGKSMYSYQLARAHRGLKRQDSVKFYLDQAISFAAKNSATNVLQNSYAEMAAHLRDVNQPFAAIDYLNRSILLRDSLYSKQGAQSLAAYQVLYDVEKKEQEIELLTKDRMLNEANSRRQQFVVYALVIGSLVLAGVLLFYYRLGTRLRKLNRVNVEKTEQLQGQAKELSAAIDALRQLNESLEEKNNELDDALRQLRKTQEQLIQAEKMASLGILSSGIAHELNNPLNFIKGGITGLEEQLANQTSAGTDDVRTYFKIIHEGVNRASTILKGLGNYSRQSERMDEPCDLHKIIDNCLMMLQSELKDRVTIEKAFCAITFPISGNEGKLHQAFLNIIQNAEQAIGEKGAIHISTTATDQAMTISIADTGCGVPQENLKRLGDPFFTTKAPGKGTGLGLSIAYKIIKDHGGRVTVQSEVGKGTEFCVVFERLS